MTSLEQLAVTLREHGQSVTSPRLAVFNALRTTEFFFMRDLVAVCPSVDRASIYRTIALFERLAIVQRVQLGWKYRLELSDPFHEHHHHATCLTCGQQLTLAENEAFESQLQTLGSAYGFTVTAHQLELRGYCQNCADRARSPL